MRRTRLARNRISSIAQKKEESKQLKEHFINSLQDLKNKCLNRELDYSEYQKLTNKKIDNRTLSDWVNYYESYEKECERQILVIENSLKKNKIFSVLAGIFVVSIIAFFLIAQPFSLTGFFTQEQTNTYIDSVNIEFNQSSEYSWILQQTGKLESIKLSGKIIGEGKVRILLEDKIILDSNKLNTRPLTALTGFSIEGESQDLSSESTTASEPSSESTTAPESTVESTTEPTTETESTTESVEEETTEPTTEEIPSESVTEETTTQTQKTDQEEAQEDKTSPSQEPLPGQSEIIENITEITPTQNVTEENATQEAPAGEIQANETETPLEPALIEQKEISFSLICEETCDLSDLNLSLDKYNIKIELEPNTALNLDSITYSIKQFEEETNLTEENITKEINITQENTTKEIEIITQNEQIVINQPVKWNKTIKLLILSNISITLPSNADKISLSKKENEKEIKLKIKDSAGKNNILSDYSSQETTEAELSQKTEEELILNINQESNQYEVLYETPAPTIEEEQISEYKKIIKVNGPDNPQYKDVKTFSNISEKIKTGQEKAIKLYWVEQNEYIPFIAIDTNNNSLIDYIEWTTPHLSNQTFEIIIEITTALHLDDKKQFVNDIYEQVKELDNIWGETIPDKHYIRVSFRENLTNKNDITIYPKVISGNPKIEIYEKDKNQIIAQFDSLINEEYNKIILSNLQNEQDSFDLRIFGGEIQVDHIVDPAISSSITYPTEAVQASTDISLESCTASNLQTDNTLYCGNTLSIDGAEYGFVNTTHHTTISDLAEILNVTVCSRFALSSKFGDNAGDVLTIYAATNATGSWVYTSIANCAGTGCSSWQTEDIRCWNITGIMNTPAKARAIRISHYLYQADADNGQSISLDVLFLNVTYSAPSVGDYPIFSDLVEKPTDPATYSSNQEYLFNATVTNTNATVWITFQGINYTASNATENNFNVTFKNLPVGTYSYNWSAYGNGTNKNFNISQTYDYTISKATASINLTLNNTQSNIKITEGQSIDLNCSLISGDPTANIELYKGDTLINNGTTQIGNTTGFNVSTLVTCLYPETQNYTSSDQTFLVQIGEEILIDSCQELNIPDMTYILEGNVTSNTTCFNITANNVTLDGQGFEINYSADGTVGFGVLVFEYNSTNVKNAIIKEGKSTNNNKFAVYYYNSHNGTIENNTLITSGSSADGIMLQISSDNNIINNTITTSGSSADGIALQISYDNNIINNTITTSGSIASGIILQTSSYNNDIINNNITTSNSGGGYGIYLSTFSSNNLLANNNLKTTGSDAYVIYLSTSSNNQLMNNIVTAYGDYADGVEITSSSSNNITNNTIIIFGYMSYGILFSSSTNNNSFSNMQIYTNNSDSYGISISDSTQNFTMDDSIINCSYSGISELYATANNGGEWNFTNVTRANGAPISISWLASYNGTLNMHWYLDVNVTNSTGQVEGADVNVTDIYEKKYSTTTDSNGLARLTLLEYVRNETSGTNFTYYSNYTINASYFAGTNDTESINLSLNKNINLILPSQTSQNTAPQITYVGDFNDSSYTIPETTWRFVEFNFTAYDENGASDLNETASANLTLAGEVTRINGSCSQTATFNTDYANYTCRIKMYYFDGTGDWSVQVTINDSSEEPAYNTTEIVHINENTAFVAGPGNITWSSLTPGVYNSTANELVLLNNTGNKPITDGNIQINATSLIGEVDDTQAIYSRNFSIGTATGANAECAATFMGWSVFTGISGATLPKGNYSTNDGSTGQEQLYFCIKHIGSELSVQSYSTAIQGIWTIKILIVALAVRRRKNKKDRILEATNLLIEELKERDSSLLKEVLDNLLLSKIEQVIPITIFSKELGGLEAICKYLREEKGMRYSEIAKALSRNDRTIWTSYKKAIKKDPEKMKYEKTTINIPLETIKSNKLTILESVIIHLKRERGMRYSEIARLINRDQRNVRTLYMRALKNN